MSQKEPENKLLSIVIVGRFNPAIINPMWLASKEIVTEEQAVSARTELIHPEISKFEVADCAYEVFLERFIVRTRHNYLFEELQDTILKILNFLEETPISQVGINWHDFYKFTEDENSVYVNFGHKYVPKEDFWNKHLKGPGLHDLHIQSNRDDGYKGKQNVFIKKVKGAERGIELLFNDHYEICSEEEFNSSESVYNAKEAIDILRNQFTKSRDFASQLLKELYEYGTK